ncbi:MAG: transposase [Dehalococcoidia bacterium]
MTPDLFKSKYRVESSRLQEWDYSQNGYYFVTICIKNREYLFGQIKNDEMILSKIGRVAEQCWYEIPNHFTFVELDEFAIMPNHIHGIIVITKNTETQHIASLQRQGPNKFGPQSENLASIMRGFKSSIKKWATVNGIDFEWQPRFYDRIIRNEEELWNVRNYIQHNHLKWNEDEENPSYI